MRFIVRMPAIIALSLGALLGAREAEAWCPTSTTNNPITCNNCTVTLTCNLDGKGTINITGSNVTFDGDWYYISNSPNHAIYVNSDNVTIKNVYISNPNGIGVYAIGGTSNYLNLEYVYVSGATAGLAHYYGGSFSAIGGGYDFSSNGINAEGYGYGGWVYLSGSSTVGNAGFGLNVNSKPGSFIYDNGIGQNGGHGAVITNSQYSYIAENRFLYNQTSGKNGLRLEISNDSHIYNNLGATNGSYDCIRAPIIMDSPGYASRSVRKPV